MRARRSARVGSGVFVVLLAAPALVADARPVAAQTGDESLEVVARDLASAWGEGRSADLAARMSADGIRLHLPDASHPVLPARLAEAALADLHRSAGRGPVTVRQVRLLGGSPARAFVDMGWRPLPAGMTEPLDYTVFAGLEEREEGWRVVEIRVLTPEGGTGLVPSDPPPHALDDNGDPWR